MGRNIAILIIALCMLPSFNHAKADAAARGGGDVTGARLAADSASLHKAITACLQAETLERRIGAGNACRQPLEQLHRDVSMVRSRARVVALGGTAADTPNPTQIASAIDALAESDQRLAELVVLANSPPKELCAEVIRSGAATLVLLADTGKPDAAMDLKRTLDGAFAKLVKTDNFRDDIMQQMLAFEYELSSAFVEAGGVANDDFYSKLDEILNRYSAADWACAQAVLFPHQISVMNVSMAGSERYRYLLAVEKHFKASTKPTSAIVYDQLASAALARHEDATQWSERFAQLTSDPLRAAAARQVIAVESQKATPVSAPQLPHRGLFQVVGLMILCIGIGIWLWNIRYRRYEQ
jgi:hypothetical protein